MPINDTYLTKDMSTVEQAIRRCSIDQEHSPRRYMLSMIDDHMKRCMAAHKIREYIMAYADTRAASSGENWGPYVMEEFIDELLFCLLEYVPIERIPVLADTLNYTYPAYAPFLQIVYDNLLFDNFSHWGMEHEVTPDRFVESDDSSQSFVESLEARVSALHGVIRPSDYPGWTGSTTAYGVPLPPDLSQLPDDDVREWAKRAIEARVWLDDESMSLHAIGDNLKWYRNIMDQVLARFGTTDSALHEYAAKLAAVDWIERDDILTEAIYEHGVPWLLSFVREVTGRASGSSTPTL